jgi:hypothetical protein
MPLHFEPGKTYEFELSNGMTIRLRFAGLGERMAAVWVDPATGAKRNEPPPFKSYKQVD